MAERELIRCANPAELFQSGASLFSSIAREAAASGRFAVALSGGSTPSAMYRLLAEEPHRDEVPWEQTDVFWGDERCVLPDRQDSNFLMAQETLLTLVPVSPSRIHRMIGEVEPSLAAEAYEREIRESFGIKAGEFPRFDLVLLGMGDDGHTASLFPGTAALAETERIVVANYVEKLRSTRLTLTLPAINHAANVIVLVSGRTKAPVLREVLANADRYPIEKVRPLGRLIYLADADALSQTPDG